MNTGDARDDYHQILAALLPLYRTTQNRDSMRLSLDCQGAGHTPHDWYTRCLRICEALLFPGYQTIIVNMA
jgi:hypothetical protein